MCLPILAAGLADRIAWVSLPYWLLWCGSFLLSIGLLVLLRKRWGRWRPLQKCAVLSLLVHVLLACIAMTIRVVVGDGGGGVGPPIRVRIVQDNIDFSMAAATSPPAAEVAPPELLKPPAPRPDEVVDAVTNAAEPVDAPPLVEPDDEVASAELPTPAVEEPKETQQVADAPSEPLVEPMVSQPIAVRAPVEPRADDAAMPVAKPQAAGASRPAPTAAAYSLRNSPGRLGLIQLQGGDERTEAAVAAALAWLARAQSPDGRWDANRFGAGQEQTVLGHNRGGAGRNADTGISALALLAFLGAGHTHQDGEYQDTVRRGLEFLIRSQAEDGNLFGHATFYAQMYCHSMATFALAEAQAMTGDWRLEPAVAKAVAYCLRAQHSATGGWRYQAGDPGDTSQLGWQMMALASAKQAGVDVPSHTWTRVGRFLRSVRRGNYEGLASYRPDGPPSTSMTAEALYCRLLLDDLAGERLAEPAAAEASGQLLAALPNAERMNLYYWYYATLSLHRRQEANHQAAAAWHSWNDALKAALLNTQLSNGPDAGSWNANTVWGGYGGRVYTTAMAAMCLEVYYRYAPAMPDDRWTATRPGSEDPAR